MKHDAGHQKTRKIQEFDCCIVDWDAVTISRDHYSISTIFITVKRSVTLISYSLTTKLQIHIEHYYFNGCVIARTWSFIRLTLWYEAYRFVLILIKNATYLILSHLVWLHLQINLPCRKMRNGNSSKVHWPLTMKYEIKYDACFLR